MAQTLTAGYEVLINKRVGNTNVPIYPFTKTGLVENASGVNLDTILAWYADVSSDTPSGIRFLTTNNTFADIRSASTSQTGIVQLSSSTSSDSETLAATPKAVKDLSDATVKLTQLAGATAGSEASAKIPTLDANDLIPSTFLPSYVDDVVEFVAATIGYASPTVDFATYDTENDAITKIYSDSEKQTEITGEEGKIYLNGGKTYRWNASDSVFEESDDAQAIVHIYSDLGKTTEIEGETSKIYVNTTNNLTYRYSGSIFVEISESLALGTTASTAFRGDLGNEVYTWYSNGLRDGNNLEVAVSSSAPTFQDTTNGGIWLQIITDETAEPEEPETP